MTLYPTTRDGAPRRLFALLSTNEDKKTVRELDAFGERWEAELEADALNQVDPRPWIVYSVREVTR